MFDQLATQIAHDVAKAIELVGIAIIAAGAVFNLALFARRSFDSKERQDALAALRSNFGRSILLGLEFLIAADIINTVAVTPTLQSVIVLGAIVLIRTFLSFSLELEIEGRWPWQRRDGEKRKS
ncbi:MAG: DUF1622 domain-containing protein [Sphingomicrobium sp.]